jgi:hypothetical protein
MSRTLERYMMTAVVSEVLDYTDKNKRNYQFVVNQLEAMRSKYTLMYTGDWVGVYIISWHANLDVEFMQLSVSKRLSLIKMY